MKKLIITPYKCIGCRTCELSCAFAHVDEGRIGKSRITVFNIKEGLNTPVTCLQCVDAACVASCKFGALVRNEKTGAISYDRLKCVKCNSCLGACPFGNVLYDPIMCNTVKCDLCGGDPMCAKFCPSQTLEYK